MCADLPRQHQGRGRQGTGADEQDPCISIYPGAVEFAADGFQQATQVAAHLAGFMQHALAKVLLQFAEGLHRRVAQAQAERLQRRVVRIGLPLRPAAILPDQSAQTVELAPEDLVAAATLAGIDGEQANLAFQFAEGFQQRCASLHGMASWRR